MENTAADVEAAKKEGLIRQSLVEQQMTLVQQAQLLWLCVVLCAGRRRLWGAPNSALGGTYFRSMLMVVNGESVRDLHALSISFRVTHGVSRRSSTFLVIVP